LAFRHGWLRRSAAELFADAVRLHQPIFPVRDEAHVDHPHVGLADEIDSLLRRLTFAYAEACFDRMHPASSWQNTRRAPTRSRPSTPGGRCRGNGRVP